MAEPWEEYKNDFNGMTDAQVQEEVDAEQSKMDEAESWLEAVASWIASGRPRTLPPP
tara:strand:- start:2941 stop:3111 length:171 start_codon:yes stop_codon:yes gene_type:complete